MKSGSQQDYTYAAAALVVVTATVVVAALVVVTATVVVAAFLALLVKNFYNWQEITKLTVVVANVVGTDRQLHALETFLGKFEHAVAKAGSPVVAVLVVLV